MIGAMCDTDTAIMGVILADGLSRRMGRGGKGLSPLGQATILQRVVTRLRPQVVALFLHADGEAGRFTAFGLPVLADGLPDFPPYDRACRLPSGLRSTPVIEARLLSRRFAI